MFLECFKNANIGIAKIVGCFRCDRSGCWVRFVSLSSTSRVHFECGVDTTSRLAETSTFFSILTFMVDAR